MAETDASKRTAGRLIILVAGFFVLGLLLWIALPALSDEKLHEFVERAGVWGPIALGGYLVLSHIIAPLGGIPAFIVGVAVFGIGKTAIYLYIASMVSAMINFSLGRVFGRPLVARLAGRKALAVIDGFSDRLGERAFFLIRVLGLAVFEEISYAAGLAHITFKKYMITTALGTVVPYAAIVFFFRDTDFSSFLNTALLLGILLAVAGISALFLRRTFSKTDGRTPESAVEN